MDSKEPSFIRLVVSVAVTGLIAAIALSGVNEVTRAKIEANQAKDKEKAIYVVLPDTTAFEAFKIENDEVLPYDGSEGPIPKGDAIFRGLNDQGEPTGWAYVFKGPGFQDTITLMFGYHRQTEKICGMKVLEHKETPGLGDKIILDQSFVSNFNDLSVRPEIVPIKDPPLTQPNQVDTISGATISSKAVIKICNGGIAKIDALDFSEVEAAKEQE